MLFLPWFRLWVACRLRRIAPQNKLDSRLGGNKLEFGRVGIVLSACLFSAVSGGDELELMFAYRTVQLSREYQHVNVGPSKSWVEPLVNIL